MKSHVSLGQHQCPICGTLHDTGEVLSDAPKTVTGMSFCPEHAQMRENGYIALIECDANGARLRRVAHIRSTAWASIFNAPVPTGGAAFILKETMDMLENIPVSDTPH